MKIDELKKIRIRVKEEEYKQQGLSPDPMDYSLATLLDHFFAEVGKLQHLWYHDSNIVISLVLKPAIADVSNLHDMILQKIKEEYENE